VSNTDQSAGVVENVHEQDRKNHNEECEFTDTREIQLQECGRDRWRHRNNAIELGKTERQANHRDDENADQCSAQNAPVIKARYQYKPQQHQDCLRTGQIAERDQGRWMSDHDLGFFECDNSQEEANTCRYGEFQILRNRIDDVLPDRENRNQKKQYARAKHGRQCLLPGVFVGQHNRESEEGVDAHTGRQRDRIVGVKRHNKGAHSCGDTGCNEHRARIHAGLAENDRVDEHDVDHRQESGDACDKFGAGVGALLRKAKISFQCSADLRTGFACCLALFLLGHMEPSPLPAGSSSLTRP
jgi:hypothetical protein